MNTQTSTRARPSAASVRMANWLAVALIALSVVVIAAAAVASPLDFKAGVLGIVQGLAEPLPISSSAHLILVPWALRWSDAMLNSQAYDVALHMGTLLALIFFFWRDWLRMILAARHPGSPDGRLFWYIVIATMPGTLIGLALDKVASGYFQDKYLLIALDLAVMGVILWIVDRAARQDTRLDGISWTQALLIGFAQALAFIPGVSRSGSTMTAGRAPGLDREAAARFSFLMAMPITFGAGVLKAKDVSGAELHVAPFWVGTAMSFLVGTLAIAFLLRYLRTHSFLPFAVYRVLVAVVVFAVYFVR